MVGSLVLNRFLIERRIGSGGFGVVYEAWDGRLERPVAVKAIEQQGEAGRRVLREAQAAARLNHPGIVTLYELGEEDGNALLVTELVEGSTLARLASAGELSDREIGEIGADLCEALDHAHSRGVVHRDIKPQNVQVTETDGEHHAKLMDFGIARLADDSALTRTGDVVGTLAYMSPEQAEGRPAGPETDVYSLALTLYECWSGENPHKRGNAAATARAIGSRHRALRRLRPDLPRELCEEIDACLARRPNQRPSLEQLGTTIEDSLDSLADHAPERNPHVLRRLAAIAVAASATGFLIAGHGALLP
ncbi:MAG: eukaryotic-like serine/threonine-protein kinase [Solirubrobacterales bacterium]|nr:eukaryotic-like serine/threonine-protein kinase [Solirubrobacterales bacterium]